MSPPQLDYRDGRVIDCLWLQVTEEGLVEEEAAAKVAPTTGKFNAHLLEVNCNPSLGVDSVYPCEGPGASKPVPPPASASWAADWHEAMDAMPYKGQKPCKCRSHHRPHLHAPCAVDLQAKVAAVSGALKIVRGEVKDKGVSASAVCEGTSYCVVVEDGRLVPPGGEPEPEPEPEPPEFLLSGEVSGGPEPAPEPGSAQHDSRELPEPEVAE